MRKAQVALEFFLYSAVFLVIVLAAYFAISFVQSADIANKESSYVKWFGETFYSATTTAMAGQGGFRYTIKFDKDILGAPYDIYFQPAHGAQGGFVYITWSSTNATYTYPIGNMPIVSADSCVHVSQSGQLLTITPSRGTLTFYNDGTRILLSQGCS
ncbi:MAG: hypothetical protein PHS02_00030 [Candidatus ainarchaeum sp.]|nr:hypothetical protein [Candidatus ainarchaeum sp.]